MNTHARILAIMLMLAVAAASAVAQPPIRLRVHEEVPPDSSDVAYYGEKHPVRATATVLGLNTAVWSFDRFVRNTEYSKISLNTIADNIQKGFVWDNDAMGTNMFMHPYHGNLYFNAARSNGYNYWQSSLFAVGGSALWEVCMENEYPSTNDIICTPVGGMALGEVTYRASDMMLDDRSTGAERVGREAAVFLISPMRGITRLISGDAWHVRPTSGREFGKPNVAMEVSTGLRLLGFRNGMADHSLGGALQVNVEYGDRFELRSSKPYDYFSLRLDLAAQKSQPLLRQLNITGRLASREVVDKPRQEMSVGMYQHYDFYDSDTLSVRTAKVPYKLAVPASFGAGVMYRYRSPGNFAVDAFAHANAVVLGGILSDHYLLDQRNYNLGSGFSAKGGVNFVLRKDVFSVQMGYEYYRLFTWGYKTGADLSRVDERTFNAEGDQSAAYFGVGEIRFDCKLAPRFYLTGSFMHFDRSTRYRDFPDVRSSSFSTRLMLTYKI